MLVSAAVVTLATSACPKTPEPASIERIVATPVATRTPRPTVKREVRSAHPSPGEVDRTSPSKRGGELVRMTWYTMGTRTASGEPVNVNAHNCAGASRWNLGDDVAIRNPRNGREVTVHINDRGAFEGMGRALDCMPAVWHTLGFSLSSGVVTVQLV